MLNILNCGIVKFSAMILFLPNQDGFSSSRNHIIFPLLLPHLPANPICDNAITVELRAHIMGSWSTLSVVFVDGFLEHTSKTGIGEQSPSGTLLWGVIMPLGF